MAGLRKEAATKAEAAAALKAAKQKKEEEKRQLRAAKEEEDKKRGQVLKEKRRLEREEKAKRREVEAAAAATAAAAKEDAEAAGFDTGQAVSTVSEEEKGPMPLVLVRFWGCVVVCLASAFGPGLVVCCSTTFLMSISPRHHVNQQRVQQQQSVGAGSGASGAVPVHAEEQEQQQVQDQGAPEVRGTFIIPLDGHDDVLMLMCILMCWFWVTYPSHVFTVIHALSAGSEGGAAAQGTVQAAAGAEAAGCGRRAARGGGGGTRSGCAREEGAQGPG